MRKQLKRKLFRTRMLLLLLLMLLISNQERNSFSRLLTQFRNNAEMKEDLPIEIKFCYELSEEEEWALQDSLEEKLWQLQCVADEFLAELGVTSVPIKIVTTLEDTVLGTYSEIDKKIYINKEFLENSTLRKAVHVVAHECHHRYQHAIIQSLLILEEADFPYENLGYYEEAVKLLEGAKNYKKDQENYYDYLQNEMELQAEDYAKQKVLEFAIKYGWKG